MASVWRTDWRDARINVGNKIEKKERKRHRTESGRVPTFNGWGKKDEPMNNFSQEVAMRGGESKISS